MRRGTYSILHFSFYFTFPDHRVRAALMENEKWRMENEVLNPPSPHLLITLPPYLHHLPRSPTRRPL